MAKRRTTSQNLHIKYGSKWFKAGDIIKNVHPHNDPANKNLYDFSKELVVKEARVSHSVHPTPIQIIFIQPNTGVRVKKGQKLEPFIADWFDYVNPPIEETQTGEVKEISFTTVSRTPNKKMIIKSVKVNGNEINK